MDYKSHARMRVRERVVVNRPIDFNANSSIFHSASCHDHASRVLLITSLHPMTPTAPHGTPPHGIPQLPSVPYFLSAAPPSQSLSLSRGRVCNFYSPSSLTSGENTSLHPVTPHGFIWHPIPWHPAALNYLIVLINNITTICQGINFIIKICFSYSLRH